MCKYFVLLASSSGKEALTGPGQNGEALMRDESAGRYSQFIGTVAAAASVPAAGLWLIYLHRYNCSRSCWLSLVSKAR